MNHAETLKALVGKTISEVTPDWAWDGERVAGVRIKFTDGTWVDIDAGTERGCEVCDEDGSGIDYLTVWSNLAEDK